jgi:small-conductance mechanosensitive channel
VTIRDMSGTIHLVPFSAVAQVSNMVRGFSFYVAEFEVARDSDIEAVKQTMRDAFALVMETDHKAVVLDDLDLQGLIAITPASMSLRARIKTLAGKQWGPGRLYSETVMRLFDERGIETPMQKVSYVNGRRGQDALPMADGEPATG